MTIAEHPARQASGDTITKLRNFQRALRNELVFLLGEDCRHEIDRMTIEQLMRLKGRTLAELMQAPDPAA